MCENTSHKRTYGNAVIILITAIGNHLYSERIINKNQTVQESQRSLRNRDLYELRVSLSSDELPSLHSSIQKYYKPSKVHNYILREEKNELIKDIP